MPLDTVNFVFVVMYFLNCSDPWPIEFIDSSPVHGCTYVHMLSRLLMLFLKNGYRLGK